MLATVLILTFLSGIVVGSVGLLIIAGIFGSVEKQSHPAGYNGHYSGNYAGGEYSTNGIIRN